MKENERLLEQTKENYSFLLINKEKMNYLQRNEFTKIIYNISKSQLIFTNLSTNEKFENMLLARKKIGCNCVLCNESIIIFKMINNLSLIVEKEVFNNSIVTNGS